jgi:hypothetical protein
MLASQLFKTAAGAVVSTILGATMSAQTPTVVVQDSLTEVRIFPSTSPDFAKVASSLGVDNSLSNSATEYRSW